MSMFKIMALSVVCVILSSVVKNYRKEFSIYIVLAAALIFFLAVSEYTEKIFEYINAMCDRVGVDTEFAEIILKVTGIAYLAEFTSSVCRDSGESALAFKVDLAGKLIILCSSLPMLQTLIETVFSLKG